MQMAFLRVTVKERSNNCSLSWFSSEIPMFPENVLGPATLMPLYETTELKNNISARNTLMRRVRKNNSVSVIF